MFCFALELQAAVVLTQSSAAARMAALRPSMPTSRAAVARLPATAAVPTDSPTLEENSSRVVRMKVRSFLEVSFYVLYVVEFICYLYVLRSMPHPSVTGDVYCFPLRQLIFSFGRRVIYHLKGLWEYIPKSMMSVRLYYDLQMNSWPSFVS